MPGNSRKPAVSVAIAYLTDVLGVRVADERPRTIPPELVVVRRVGGVKRNEVLDAPWLMLECWAVDDQAAEDLCMRAADAMEAAPGSFIPYVDGQGRSQEAWISDHSEIGGPASNPDDDQNVDRGRWTTTVEWLISTNV
jgi:hypothetical protein